MVKATNYWNPSVQYFEKVSAQAYFSKKASKKLLTSSCSTACSTASCSTASCSAASCSLPACSGV